jgi:hypothetical protein
VLPITVYRRFNEGDGTSTRNPYPSVPVDSFRPHVQMQAHGRYERSEWRKARCIVRPASRWAMTWRLS